MAAWRISRTLMWLEKRSPRRDSTSDEARARISPVTTMASSRATTRQSGVSEAPGCRARAITASMISFATQSDATGTKARARRSNTIAIVKARCVSHTSRRSAGR